MISRLDDNPDYWESGRDLAVFRLRCKGLTFKRIGKILRTGEYNANRLYSRFVYRMERRIGLDLMYINLCFKLKDLTSKSR